jgi:putative endonuclease
MVTNKRDGVLYIGVTTNLKLRARQHRSGNGSTFTKKYNCTRLVYFEAHPDVASARARERQMKAWQRSWKINLIEEQNPQWLDLGDDVPRTLRSQPSLG